MHRTIASLLLAEKTKQIMMTQLIQQLTSNFLYTKFSLIEIIQKLFPFFCVGSLSCVVNMLNNQVIDLKNLLKEQTLKMTNIEQEMIFLTNSFHEKNKVLTDLIEANRKATSDIPLFQTTGVVTENLMLRNAMI